MGRLFIELKERGHDGVEWSYLAQDRDNWRAVVNTEMNLSFPQNAGNFLTNYLRNYIQFICYVCFVDANWL
jgi:hypothetical protein